MIATPITMDVPLRTDDHGLIRVGNTKVRLEQVVHAFREGETAEGILDMYSTLKLEDVYAVLSYYLSHREEVDAYGQRIQEDEENVLKELEAKYTPEHRALHERIRQARKRSQP